MRAVLSSSWLRESRVLRLLGLAGSQAPRLAKSLAEAIAAMQSGTGAVLDMSACKLGSKEAMEGVRALMRVVGGSNSAPPEVEDGAEAEAGPVSLLPVGVAQAEVFESALVRPLGLTLFGVEYSGEVARAVVELQRWAVQEQQRLDLDCLHVRPFALNTSLGMHLPGQAGAGGSE